MSGVTIFRINGWSNRPQLTLVEVNVLSLTA